MRNESVLGKCPKCGAELIEDEAIQFNREVLHVDAVRTRCRNCGTLLAVIFASGEVVEWPGEHAVSPAPSRGRTDRENDMKPAIRISPLPALSPEADRVLVQAIFPDATRMQAAVEYIFSVNKAEIDDLQWYFETFLQFDEEPAPTMARRIEQHLRDRGRELFRSVLDGNNEVRALWRAFRPHLADADFEIVSQNASGAAVHWEFLQDPEAEGPISTEVRAFVHVPATPVPPAPIVLAPHSGNLRVLLAIERPGGVGDVPYRSVAAGLVGAAGAGNIRIDVLRPPDFDRLAEVMNEAAQAGKPYDILHFDGHGAYAGGRGKIVFEDPSSPRGGIFVDGHALGELMARTGTGTLVLNACRSAYVDPRVAKPADVADGGVALTVGSFAEEAIRAGARHVVAMRYNFYVVTATRFVAALYDALGRGWPLGEAVTAARRDLALRPERTIGAAEMPLQDWAVPVLYRAEGVIEPPGPSGDPRRQFAPAFDAPSPFVGRHETLYRIDRWFDSRPVVLLWGQAGVGKSATAREFAQWYLRTAGITEPAEFTLLQEEPRPPLPLDDTGAPELPEFAARIADRRGLWVIDGLQCLTPSQTGRLRALVLAAADRGAKVIVTARGFAGWDDSRVACVLLPPMPPDECQQLVSSLSRGGQATGSSVRTLLQFSRGNPQVLRLVLDLAPVNGSTDPQALEQLVDSIAAGDIDLTPARFGPLRQAVDDLRNAVPPFRAPEMAMIVPLRLFRGYASVASLGTMGELLPALAAATPAGLMDLLGRLELAGMADDFGSGGFCLHPLLPAALRPFFDEQYPPGSPAERQVRQAFCGALGKGCGIIVDAYNKGARFAIDEIKLFDASLASAWEMSCREGWWHYANNILSARCMYAFETSQDAMLQRLLDGAASVLVDPSSNGAIPGREDGWEIWMSFDVRALRRQENWQAADKLLADVVKVRRERVASALRDGRVEPWSPEERSRVALLAGELYQQGVVKLGLRDSACVAILNEAAELARRANDPGLAAKVDTVKVKASLLAGAPPDSVPPELQQAMSSPNRTTAATACMTLGEMKLELLTRLLADNPVGTDALMGQARDILLAAKRAFQKALDLLPPHLEEQAAEANLQLGEIELQLFDWTAAQTSFANALQIFERIHRPAEAAAARASLALAMRANNRLDQAVIYAKAALQYYEKFDPVRASGLLSAFPALQSPAEVEEP